MTIAGRPLEAAQQFDTTDIGKAVLHAVDTLRAGNGATAIGTTAGEGRVDLTNAQRVLKDTGMGGLTLTDNCGKQDSLYLMHDGSILHHEANKDVVMRPDGSQVVVTKDGPSFYDANGKPIEMSMQNSKFSGSGYRLPDGTTISGYYMGQFQGNGTIAFPGGDEIKISNGRVVR